MTRSFRIWDSEGSRVRNAWYPERETPSFFSIPEREILRLEALAVSIFSATSM